MVFIQCGNLFNVSGDTNASFTGTMKLNGTTLTSYNVMGNASGFFINGIGTLKGTSFTFSLSKYSTINCNNKQVIILSDYNVRFNGTSFIWN